MEPISYLSLFADQTVRSWELQDSKLVNIKVLHENVVKIFYFNNDKIITEKIDDKCKPDRIQVYAIITNDGKIIVIIHMSGTVMKMDITKDFESEKDSINDITNIHFNRIIGYTSFHKFSVFVVCSQRIHEFLYNQDKKLMLKKSYCFNSPIEFYQSHNGSAIMRTVDGDVYIRPPFSVEYRLLNETIGRIHITSFDKITWTLGSHPVILTQNKVYLVSRHDIKSMTNDDTEIIDIFVTKDVSDLNSYDDVSLIHKITSDGKCYRDNVHQSCKYPAIRFMNREVFPGRYIRKIFAVEKMMIVIFDNAEVCLCEKSSKPESYVELDGIDGGNIYDICGSSKIFIVNYDGSVWYLNINKSDRTPLTRSDITISKIDYFDTEKLAVCLPSQVKSARTIITDREQ